MSPDESRVPAGAPARPAWISALERIDALPCEAACAQLAAALADATVTEWLQCIQQLRLRRQTALAGHVAQAALAQYPDTLDLRRALAMVLFESGQLALATAALETIEHDFPGDAATTLTLARALAQGGRAGAAASVTSQLFAATAQPVDVLIQAVEILDGCDRKTEALRLCENAIAAGSTDTRLHMYAGSLANQLGRFMQAREYFMHVLKHDQRAHEWFVANGLAIAQRYAEASHPDFALFEQALMRSDLSPRARASLLFALGKGFDDIDEIGQAATRFREGNALRRQLRSWSRDDWQHLVQSRLRAQAPAPMQRRADWTPVFIVGIPRSGSSLVAARLSSHAGVRNRGELPWLQHLARQLPDPASAAASRLHELADIYQSHLLQDDAPARFYLDKQPLNLLFLDLILGLWPHAKIVHCHRAARAVALSLWMQDFADAQHGYAFDFDEIRAFMHGCEQLMTHWQQRYPHAINRLDYETFVARPDACIAALGAWIGIDPLQSSPDATAPGSIATASLWQARQPVYSRSIGRWRAYAQAIPELAMFSEA
jgi:tetratricopeptide (TPR) repeat protein